MNNFKQAIEDIKNGKPIVVMDDDDREGEGDLVIAAEKADKYNIIFLLRHGRGLMCIPCLPDRLDRLNIGMMHTNKLDKFGTPFACSVDALEGTTTGMSAEDRLKTISIFVDENSKAEQLCQPGHMFPLRARPGLLKERRGHTESSLELVKFAGLKPVSIIVEIMNGDGSMTKGKQLIDYGKIYNLEVLTTNEIYDQVYNKSIQSV